MNLCSRVQGSATLGHSRLYFRKSDELVIFLKFLHLSSVVQCVTNECVGATQIATVQTSCSCCRPASLPGGACPGQVWVGRGRCVPWIPSGIMAEFCHRMFHRPLGLVGIQSSQSFSIWGLQLLSISCTPNGAVGSKAPSTVVLGKENPSQKKWS